MTHEMGWQRPTGELPCGTAECLALTRPYLNGSLPPKCPRAVPIVPGMACTHRLVPPPPPCVDPNGPIQFDMKPLTNGGAPRCYLLVLSVGPVWCQVGALGQHGLAEHLQFSSIPQWAPYRARGTGEGV